MSDATLVGCDEATPRLPAQSSQPVASLASLDTRAFRQTMGLFATGVTVITARMNGSVHGMTANAVTSVSLDPLLVLAAINRRASMSNIIQQAGEFAINILSERQEEVSRHFAGAKTGPQPASLRFEFLSRRWRAVHRRHSRCPSLPRRAGARWRGSRHPARPRRPLPRRPADLAAGLLRRPLLLGARPAGARYCRVCCRFFSTHRPTGRRERATACRKSGTLVTRYHKSRITKNLK